MENINTTNHNEQLILINAHIEEFSKLYNQDFDEEKRKQLYFLREKFTEVFEDIVNRQSEAKLHTKPLENVEDLNKEYSTAINLLKKIYKIDEVAFKKIRKEANKLLKQNGKSLDDIEDKAEALYLETLKTVDSCSRLIRSEPDSLLESSQTKTYTKKIKEAFTEVDHLHYLYQPLELPNSYASDENPLFKGYKIIKRECLAGGCNGITEKVRLKEKKSGKEGDFVCKTSNVNIFFDNAILSEQAEEKGVILRHQHLSSNAKKVLFNYFGKNGQCKKHPLSKSQINEIREKAFGDHDGGKDVLNDEALQELASQKVKSPDDPPMWGLNSHHKDLKASRWVKPGPINAEKFFFHEAYISKILFEGGSSNPHIAKTICCGTDPHEGWYLIQEYAPGITVENYLRTRIANGDPVDIQKFLAIGQQVLDGLAFLHSKNVVHKDIKANNIQISMKDEVKILDLGEAVIIGSGEMMGGGVCSGNVPEYIIQNSGDDFISTASDCYLAGQLLLNLLCLTNEQEEQVSNLFRMVFTLSEQGAATFNSIHKEVAVAETGFLKGNDFRYLEAHIYKEIENLVFANCKSAPEDVKQNIINVVYGLLRLDPKDRLTAKEASEMLAK